MQVIDSARVLSARTASQKLSPMQYNSLPLEEKDVEESTVEEQPEEKQEEKDVQEKAPLEEKFISSNRHSEAFARKLAFARTSIGVTMRDSGECKIEESVYGAAIVMPQIARTVGWDKTMTMLTFHTYLFLLINIFLQAYMLRMIAKEENVMDGFGGQMFLCDFGAHLENCPGPGCIGPFGTNITAPRLYSWSSIAIRNFARQSLQTLFPDKLNEISLKVDPGEYGLESYWCRLACCFIFMICCMGELAVTVKMFQLLYKIPTQAEPWIVAKPRDPDAQMMA
jgi:hypothetical protein